MNSEELRAAVHKAWMELPLHERQFRQWRRDGCLPMSREYVDSLLLEQEREASLLA
jgi:hypothetical protein